MNDDDERIMKADGAQIGSRSRIHSVEVEGGSVTVKGPDP
jgi:hypothetical protein